MLAVCLRECGGPPPVLVLPLHVADIGPGMLQTVLIACACVKAKIARPSWMPKIVEAEAGYALLNTQRAAEQLLSVFNDTGYNPLLGLST